MQDFKLIDLDKLVPAQEPAEQPADPQPAKGIYNPIKRQQEAEQEALTAYKAYQTNILKAGQLKADINKGILKAENPYKLLLKAIECISIMTSESLFYSQNEANIKAIYGAGLLDPQPLQTALNEITERLNKLIEAEQRETNSGNKSRIKQAITAHQQEQARIKAILQK